ncbi:putative ACR [uncultured archaeon]|nr:putative ACR [uncultured archaeon]
MLFNNTSGKKIMEKTRIADDPSARGRGLMFEARKNFDYALIFVLPNESIVRAMVHMLFVFFPIDIVFLDSKRRVVDKATLKPWMLNYTPKAAAKYFIEMPVGKSKFVKFGDIVSWQ